MSGLSQCKNNMSVYKRNNKYWVAFRYNKRRYRKASPDNTSSGAKAFEALLRQRLAKGESIESPTKKDEKISNFQDFSKKWLDVYVKTNNKKSEAVNKESILRVHLVPFFGKKLLSEINGLDVESFKAKEIKAGLSNKSINNFLIVLSRCLKVAVEWGVIKDAPKIKLLKVQAQKFDHLSEDECKRLLSSCDDFLRDMVVVALKTGLRFGELVALELKDVDIVNRQLTVKQSLYRGVIGSTKTNRIRFIPLLDDVSDILQLRANKNGHIFTRDDGKYLSHAMCINWLRQACQKAGLRRIGWHTLRHTFASQLAQRGISVIIIQSLLGHSDIKTTMRYSHLTTSVTRDAVLQLNNSIGHNMATNLNTETKKLTCLIPLESEISQKSQ